MKGSFLFSDLSCCAVQGSLFGKGNLTKQFPWGSPSVLVQDFVFQKSIVFPSQTRIKINPSSNAAKNTELKSLSGLQLGTGARSSTSAGFQPHLSLGCITGCLSPTQGVVASGKRWQLWLVFVQCNLMTEIQDAGNWRHISTSKEILLTCYKESLQPWPWLHHSSVVHPGPTFPVLGRGQEWSHEHGNCKVCSC